MARFTKDGREREATTPAAAVRLRFEGWREVQPEVEPETTPDPTDETPEETGAKWRD